jgi:hypothetical protein
MDLFFYLFNDFVGGADDDNLSIEYLNLDLNNKNVQINFIKNEIKTFFENNFSENQKIELLNILNKLLAKEIEITVNDFDNNLFPFNTPQNILELCETIKNTLYPTIINLENDILPAPIEKNE